MADDFPPRDLDAERALIGAMTLGPEVVEAVSQKIGPADFYGDTERQAFLAVRDRVLDVGGQVGMTELWDIYRDCPDIEQMLAMTTSTAEYHVDYYAKRILDVSQRRAAINRGRTIIDAARDMHRPTDEVLDLAGLTPRDSSSCGVSFADIDEKEVDWLWRNWLPMRKLVLLGGDEGIGKSFLLASIAATVTTEGRWPDGSRCEAGSVVLFMPEDDPDDTTLPRLREAGAELEKVIHVPYDDEIGITTLPEQVGRLERILRERGDVRLIIFDPITTYLGRTDTHKEVEVRAALSQLKQIAQQYNTCIVNLLHTSKDEKRTGLTRFLGSKAFTAFHRVVIGVRLDENDDQRRQMVCMKNNLAQVRNGYGYAIRGRHGHVEWEREPIDGSGRDFFAQTREPGKHEKCMAFVLRLLAAGPMPSLEFDATCASAGSKGGTLQRATKELGVCSEKDTERNCWMKRLPDPDWEEKLTTPDHGGLGDVGCHSEQHGSKGTKKTNTTIGVDTEEG